MRPACLAASLPTCQSMLVWFSMCLAGFLSSLAAAAQPLLCRSATACWLSWGCWSCSWGLGTQAGVQLSEAASIQAWGCLQRTSRVVSWNISQSKCNKPVCIVSPFLLVVRVSPGWQLPLSVPCGSSFSGT